jgi:hypothetical protein
MHASDTYYTGTLLQNNTLYSFAYQTFKPCRRREGTQIFRKGDKPDVIHYVDSPKIAEQGKLQHNPQIKISIQIFNRFLSKISKYVFQGNVWNCTVHRSRVSYETSFDSKQPKMEPKLVSTLSETRRLFRLFRFNIETACFGVSIEPKRVKRNRNKPKKTLNW